MRSFFIRPASQQLIRSFPSIRLTLSPLTGRRPDYTIFSVDIGVADVTRNSRLFAVTSTTCSTLSKELVLVTAVFSPPIDIKQALQSGTTSQCVRADSSSQRQKKALNSHKLRDRHTRYI